MNRICRECGFEFDISLFPTSKNRLGKKYHRNTCKFCFQKQVTKCNKKNFEQRKNSNLEGFRKEERGRSRKWRANHKAEHYAHTLLKRAIEKGEIKKPCICSKCGKQGIKINGHHEDYSKPYEVVWLCDVCHKKRHVDIRKKNAQQSNWLSSISRII